MNVVTSYFSYVIHLFLKVSIFVYELFHTCAELQKIKTTKMNKTKTITPITLFLVVLISTPTYGQMNMESKELTSVVYEVGLKTDMRKLWVDHIIWTRNVIFCLVDDLPGTDHAVKRLLLNQDDIGKALIPYYGEKAGNQLTELLYSHITIFPEVIKAAKAENKIALDKANIRWYENANEISEFLCKLNPTWKLADMKLMMHNHLKLTNEEAMNRIKKDYVADVVTYDKIHLEILTMADMFSEGILNQNLEKIEPNTYPLIAK